MDMDPMTRREADKVEGILVDLMNELKLLSLLPEEFSSWVRGETVVAAMSDESSALLQLYEAHAERKAEAKRAQAEASREGMHNNEHASAPPHPLAAASTSKTAIHNSASNTTGMEKPTPSTIFLGRQANALADSDDDAASSSAASSAGWAEELGGGTTNGKPRDGDPLFSDVALKWMRSSSLSPEDEEERQRAIKAACFLHTAAQYGDPADVDDNEAVVQVSEFAQLERDLLDGATTTGYADPNDVQMHHLSTRALVDTLRESGYDTALQYFLKRLYKSSRSAQGGRRTASTATAAAAAVDAAAANTAQMHVYGCGMVEESVDHLHDLVATLHRLIHERNQSTVNEDIHRYQLLHDAVNKDQAGTADVQVLNQRFLDVKAARRREVAELDAEIEQLEEELLYVRQAADVELEAFQKVQETIQNDHRCSLRQQLEAHRNAAEAVARRLQQAQAKDLDELNSLRSQRTKREAAVSGAIADYDGQTAQLTTAMHELNEEAEADTEKIVRLEAEVQALQRQKEEHAWEATVAEQRQEHAGVIRQRQEQDARVIQAYYRAFRARLQAQQALEKGGKKGKKKGGAKK